MRSYSATDVGRKRKINQDSIFASDAAVGHLPNLYIVADGMGGHNAGDFASRYAVKAIAEHIAQSDEHNPIKLINEAVQTANEGIMQEAAGHEELAGMGTTIVVTTVYDRYAYTANVGDSRQYMFGPDGLRQVTRDHSLVEEMVRMGEITEADARTHPDKHIITRALGATQDLAVDFFDYELEPDTILLMCSDGLTNMVENGEIGHILSGDVSLEEKAEQLIGRANENGGKDNIAVILIRPDEDEV